ncbi:MAG: hypothetical protein ACHQUC_10995, partial [Chlamydiales bacterium]
EYNPSIKLTRLSDPNGATLEFYLHKSKTTLASPLYAISNALGDEPSGKYDPRNTNFQYQGKWIIVTSPEGIKRFYLQTGTEKKEFELYLLFKEVMLNGKVLRYHYDRFNAPRSH